MGSLLRSLLFAALLIVPGLAGAQTAMPAEPLMETAGRRAGSVIGTSRLSFEGALEGMSPSARPAGARQAPVAEPDDRRKPVWRRVVGAAAGAAGGFFGGGYLGAAIEGDRCNCDDPGLKGALIGAPLGAIAGGIVGGMFLF